MTNKDNLNEKELENVSGGDVGRTNELLREYSNLIKKDDAINHKCETLLFVCYSSLYGGYSCVWMLGTLINVYEKSSGCSTDTMAKVAVIEGYYESYSGTQELNLDKWSVYSK